MNDLGKTICIRAQSFIRLHSALPFRNLKEGEFKHLSSGRGVDGRKDYTNSEGAGSALG